MQSCTRVAPTFVKPAGRVRSQRLAPCASAQEGSKGSRRAFAATLALGPAVLLADSAWAFGSGFPGYDVNVEARQRATDRVNVEKEYQKKLGKSGYRLPTGVRAVLTCQNSDSSGKRKRVNHS
eukprot:1177660-Prorocentrum_minimum.AAC.2